MHGYANNYAYICWCGSMAEQIIRNDQVAGSIPVTSSKKSSYCKDFSDSAIADFFVSDIRFIKFIKPIKQKPSRISIIFMHKYAYPNFAKVLPNENVGKSTPQPSKLPMHKYAIAKFLQNQPKPMLFICYLSV